MPRNAEAVTLYFTQTCNLQCKYCYAPHHKNESKIREKLLDKSVFDFIKEVNGIEYKSLDLWGGETTQNLFILTSLIDDTFISTYMPKVEDFGFSTNLATQKSVDDIIALKEKILSLKENWPIKQVFTENRFQVQVSFDGPVFFNDATRIGSHIEKILEGIGQLQQAGILVQPKGTLSPTSIEQLAKNDIVYDAYDNFAKYLELQYDLHFTPTHIYPYPFTKEDGRNMTLFNTKEHAKGRITNFDKTLESALARVKMSKKYDAVGCSAGKPYNLHIDVDKNIHWCHHSYGAKDNEKAPRPGYSEFSNAVQRNVVDMNDKLDLARFDYLTHALNDAFSFEINYTLSMIDLLAKSDLLSPIYKESSKMQKLLAITSITGGNCVMGDYETTKEYLIPNGSYLKLLGNGALEESISFLRSRK